MEASKYFPFSENSFPYKKESMHRAGFSKVYKLTHFLEQMFYSDLLQFCSLLLGSQFQFFIQYVVLLIFTLTSTMLLVFYFGCFVIHIVASFVLESRKSKATKLYSSGAQIHISTQQVTLPK